MEIVKGFDLAEYKEYMGEKLGAAKAELIAAVKAPAKIAVGGSVDYLAGSCLAHQNAFVKGLSGLVASVKQPLLDAIDKV